MFDKNWLSMGGLLGPRYKTSSLQEVMNHLFEETTFNKSLTFTMVNAYNLDTQEPKFFRSWKNEEIFRTQDIAVATGSAPSYFTPYSMSPINKTETEVNYKLIDGGMIVNSSAECLLIEAKKLFPYAKEFNIVSLGTGKFQLPLSYNTLKTAGLLTWAQKAPAIASGAAVQKAIPATVVSMDDDSQEFEDVDWDESLDHAMIQPDPPSEAVQHVEKVLHPVVSRLLSNCFGEDHCPEDAIHTSVVDCWTSIAQIMVFHKFRQWDNYLDPVSVESFFLVSYSFQSWASFALGDVTCSQLIEWSFPNKVLNCFSSFFKQFLE